MWYGNKLSLGVYIFDMREYITNNIKVNMLMSSGVLNFGNQLIDISN